MDSSHPGCQWFERVWNQRNPRAMYDLALGGLHAHGADGQRRTLEEFESFYRLIVTAVPDIHVSIENCVTGDSYAAIHWHATGTHTGSAEGMPATGNRIDVHGLSLMRMEGDRIAEGWDSYDFAGLMKTLGAGV